MKLQVGHEGYQGEERCELGKSGFTKTYRHQIAWQQNKPPSKSSLELRCVTNILNLLKFSQKTQFEGPFEAFWSTPNTRALRQWRIQDFYLREVEPNKSPSSIAWAS